MTGQSTVFAIKSERLRNLALAVGLAGLGGSWSACGEVRAGKQRPLLLAERVALDLLTEVRTREVLAENPSDPVHVRLFRREGKEDLLQPGLALTPPACVRFPVPPIAAGAVLRLSPCLKEKARERAGLLGYRVEFAGKVYFDAAQTCAQWLDNKAEPIEIDTKSGGDLVLRTTWESASDPPPPAGFSGLAVHSPLTLVTSSPSVDAPNVLLIVVDTLRADRLHCYGNPKENSPVIDALAARGILFEQAFSDSSWTVPSTTSIMTGLTPEQHGVNGLQTQFLFENLATLAESFLYAGLDTAGFSCNPLLSRGVNFDQGFLHYQLDGWSDAEAVLPDVEAWLEQRTDTRFFLYLHLVDPHDPYLPPTQERARFAADVPKDWQAEKQLLLARKLTQAAGVPSSEIEEAIARNSQLYDAEIASLDRSLGRLFAHLEERGMLEHTLIALTSDHGEEFLEHGLIGHSLQLHKEAVHVPLLLAGPGVPAGARRRELQPIRRLAATLLNLAGVNAGRFSGESGLLDPRAVPSAVHSSTVRGMMRDEANQKWQGVGLIHALRTAEWELHWASEISDGSSDPLRLWNLIQDPDARRNVAAEQPAVVAKLKAELEQRIRTDQRVGSALSEGEAERERLQATGYIGADEED